jgi:hypothetical protein
MYPEEKPYSQAIRGKNAELIVASCDAELMSLNYFETREMECLVKDKEGNNLGKTPRRHDDGKEIYKQVAKDVAQMLGKERVKITIR